MRNAIQEQPTNLPNVWFGLRGRISRGTYWTKFMLPLIGLQVAATFVDLALGYGSSASFGPVGLLVSLLILWPSITGLVKRLHDLGHPGWLVPAYYGGLIGGAVAVTAAGLLIGEVAMLVAAVPLIAIAVLACWYSIKVMFFRGIAGPNEYGPDPLAWDGPHLASDHEIPPM